MFKLKDRQERRNYIARVNAGEVKDFTITHGTTAGGIPVDAKGTPLIETAEPPEENGDGATDYTKLTSHEQLDNALGARAKPEGWDDRNKFKVVDKQTWLASNPATPGGGW